MIDVLQLETQLKKGDILNGYVFCGQDENLIKDSIHTIVNKAVNKDFADLNYHQFDGGKTEIEEIIQACETLPFMSDQKVVVIYRATFLKDSAEGNKQFNSFAEYAAQIPPHCILIAYYVFENDREKPSNKVKKIEKKVCVVKADKLKGEALYTKVKNLFAERGKKIARAELTLFCSQVDHHMDILTNEIEKLCAYVMEREITKEDILLLAPQKSENDIFNLVDYVSQKNIKKILDSLNELTYKGEKITMILYMIQRQFKLLLDIKLGMEQNKSKETLAQGLKLHPYICEKMMGQSKKFTVGQLKNSLELCLDTEKKLKSSSTDPKIQLELMLVQVITNAYI